MPNYAFVCPSCQTRFDRMLPRNKRLEPQACTCGAVAEQVVADSVGAVLRGDAWAGKALQVKDQMNARRNRVGRKENELAHDGPQLNLAPNVNGERTDTWAEAGKLAASLGKDTGLYEDRARKEEAGRTK